ncbi:uncharacterized protein N7473_001912 [Penicillium subrubescens]|uniref:Uncharacterized protein n=1 Tax=Penicillium subrubescens TaxID=1316194 RepID=A0A1Q5SQT7_9EURO|nr:uncharacterized protein N7473_001912 [Penicillium subrubescens]KAJ5904996.1 hypothetical protein N7473_001912 [Penicillium subrubescens]OKO90357.1 hypothetical protein PENSUB_13490 [Penicillium subrubescens]
MESKTPQPEKGESLLVASLAELDHVDETLLVQTLQDSIGDNIRVQLWHPPKLGLPQPFYDNKGRRDSKANIYGLAVLAHRDGKTGFLVADRLTKRQLKGDPRPGESSLLSVVMVGIRSPSKTSRTHADHAESETTEHIRVIAKRHTIKITDSAAVLSLLDKFELSYTFLGGHSIDITTRLCDYGLELHDPDHTVFIPDTAITTGREAFEQETKAALLESTPLPAELVASIVSRLDHRSKPDSGSMGVQSENLVIFLTFPTTEDELDSTQSSLQREVQRCLERRTTSPAKRKREESQPDIRVQLIPWEQKSQATRRDLEYHWKERHDRSLCPLNYLLVPITPSRQALALGDAQFGSIYHGNDGFVLMARNTLDQMVKTKVNHLNGRLSEVAQPQEDLKKGNLPDSSQVEFLIGPDEPFYYNPPLWEPVNGEGLISIAVFYLTNKLSIDQIRALKTELLMDNTQLDGQKACCFVPWEDGHTTTLDGTIDDIWRIFWEMRRCTSCQMPIFFIDEQSGIDQTILMVDTDHYIWQHDDERATELLKDVEDASTKGLLYGRIKGRDAHDGHVNLSMGNLNFDEFLESCGLDQEHRYPRPGWPGHGILENEE